MTSAEDRTGLVARYLRGVAWLAAALLLIATTVLLVRAVDARSMAPLQWWHTYVPHGEYRVSDPDRPSDLEALIEQEARLFAEVGDAVPRLHGRHVYSRYDRSSPSSPLRFERDWNRTFVFPAEDPIGGAILVHGLSDSPYSVRAVGELLHELGFYVVGLRMPGHGTVPGALVRATHRDWKAVVEMGVAHVREQVPAPRPLVALGYSNGAALVLTYALEARRDRSLPRLSRVVLLSPAVQVSEFTRFARLHRLVSALPPFEQFRWQSIQPEYDPFKYNSFPKIAGAEICDLVEALQAELGVLDPAEGALPPILTFQSIVDATVVGEGILSLYRRLEGEQNELVLFDLNRQSSVQHLLAGLPRELLDVMRSAPLGYARTLITNEHAGTARVKEVRWSAQGAQADRVLDLSWPTQVFSLSHVALPFSEADPLYGTSAEHGDEKLGIGRLAPRGERNVLVVPPGSLVRLRYNPFFSYLAERIAAFVTAPQSAPSLGIASPPG